MSLQFLLTIAFAGAFLTYFSGKISSKIRNFLAVFISLLLVAIVAFFYNKHIENTLYLKFFDIPLALRLNALSWFFAITITVVGSLSVIFSLSYIKGRERTDFYYLMMMLVNASMLGIVLSGDFVSFYIFWEIMSWSAFLLISYNRGPAIAAGMKYIIMSIIGSIAMLMGMLSLYTNYGTLSFSEIASLITSASSGYVLFILILFCIAFGIKNAVLPFHTWLPDAHSEAPSPFSAILSGILIKIGTYGFILIFYVIVGLRIFRGLFGFRYILLILGAITILVPSFIAMLQDDAKRLLAWSSIGQVGYIILGITFGTSLSITSGIFHFFNHAAFKALLFLSVGAVEYRTRTRDLNSLGGLIKKMPITFIGALVGTCGLIGVPLTNGFVSKWLLYKTLILKPAPFLAFVSLIGTWAAIFYSYKLIHNIFLGQLPEKYNNLEKEPFSMQLPIIILSGTIILFGIFPGIPLKVINTIGTSFGFESLNITIWGVSAETGILNTINIFFTVLIAGIISWMLFRAGRRSIPVSQEDSYAAGAYIPKEKYHYTVKFYNPLYRMIIPYLRDVIDEFYYWIANSVKKFCNGVRKIYTGDVGNYVLYIIFFLALLIFIQLRWRLW
jgi:proton-translocating NADH-quinone oxidoreductase chain M